MFQPVSKADARSRIRGWAVLCAIAVVSVTVVAVRFDYGRFGEAFFRSPLYLFKLPSVWAILGSYLLCGSLVLGLACRRVANETLHRMVWLLAAALCICSLSAWFALDQAERVGEDAFAASAVILSLVSLPCLLFILVGVPAAVVYAIRKAG